MNFLGRRTSCRLSFNQNLSHDRTSEIVERRSCADFLDAQLRGRNEVSCRSNLYVYITCCQRVHESSGPMELVNFATRRTRSFPLRIMTSIAFIVNCTRSTRQARSLSRSFSLWKRGLTRNGGSNPLYRRTLKGLQPLFTRKEIA